MNIQQLHAKYAAGGAVEPQGISRADIEALVAEALSPADTGLGALRKRFAEGGAVFGGGNAPAAGWREGDVSPEQIAAILGPAAGGAASNQMMQATHTPSAYWYDQNYDPAYAKEYWAMMGQPEPQRPAGGVQDTPTYAPPGNQAAWGGSQPASANPNGNPPPTQPNGATAPGQAGNGLGLPSMTGQTRYPYMPTTVYQQPAQMSSEGSWFPINYNASRIGDLVAHLRSQMYA